MERACSLAGRTLHTSTLRPTHARYSQRSLTATTTTVAATALTRSRCFCCRTSNGPPKSAPAKPAPAPAKASPAPAAGAPATSHAVQSLWKAYNENTSIRLKTIDAFLVFLMLSGIVQFLYCVLVTNFPFNAFLAGCVVLNIGVLRGVC